ncbi:hypothetical protein [Martelella alba]|uniref:Uncharacterized protein n=1 Tax=Martelella alba TaxID=2590451 RepID=A0ABY2SH93_9HYPH|nr:hypothetical protein [Martelella alba]TKI03557.1 hypothetical protein FCN80_20985 [Martelella alba]
MPSTLQQYLDETLYIKDGGPVKRGDEMDIHLKKFLAEIWPIAFHAGYEKAVQDGFKAKPRSHQRVKLPEKIIP